MLNLQLYDALAYIHPYRHDTGIAHRSFDQPNVSVFLCYVSEGARSKKQNKVGYCIDGARIKQHQATINKN
jgi:hypothetical protein